jgi:hypothetical protein
MAMHRWLRNLRRCDHRPLYVGSLHGIHPSQVVQFSESVSQRVILRQNYFAILAVDIDFLLKEVDPIYNTKTNLDRDTPR